MPSRAPAVCVLGHHELDYPRNRTVQRLIRAAGYEVVPCHSLAPFPLRHAILLRRYLQIAERVDAIWVTEGGHRLVPAVKAAAMLTGKPVIFDPFTSRYDTRVQDRRLHAPGSYQAFVASFQDWSSCAAADTLVFDTAQHRDYFMERYRPRARTFVLEVGVDESVFEPTASPPPDPQGRLRVLFYGTYIPLQGIEHIVEAATLLREHPGLSFHLVGRGQQWPQIERMLEQRALPNLTTEGLVSPPELARRISDCDVCLGIFGITDKAGNVVPNKVVQCAAMGRPIVTRRSQAIESYFTDRDNALLVPPGDPTAIAEALVQLHEDARLRRNLGQAARAAFERSFSEQTLTRTMARILEATIAGVT